MDIVYLFNGFEAVLWIFMAVYIGRQAILTPQRRRWLLLGAVTFVAFSGSEIVEMKTGAWWRPIWLMIWKGVCIAILVTVGLAHFKWRRAVGKDIPAPPDESASDDAAGPETNSEP